MKIVRITALLAVVLVATVAFAQTKTKMETNRIEAKTLSDEHDIVVVKQCKIVEVNGKKD